VAVVDNKVLRRKDEGEREKIMEQWSRIQNEELHNWYSTFSEYD
jgi:hypothetical protein